MTLASRMAPLMIAVLTVVGLPAATSASDWHVAPTGADTNAGTHPEAAFRTLRVAASRMKPGDVCHIHAGIYRESLVPPTDGTADAPLLFQAAAGEHVTISGLDAVIGWERVDATTFRAEVDWDLGPGNQVFRDGKPLTEARWPNRGSDDPFDPCAATVAPEGSDFDRLHCGEFPETWTADSLAGATVWCLAQWRWSSWTAPVKGYDPASRTALLQGHDTWWVRQQHNPGTVAPRVRDKAVFEPGVCFISNARALLDAPGEWYYDPQEKQLFLCVAAGDDPNRSLLEMKRRRLAVDLTGRSHCHVEGCEIFGASASLRDARNCRLSRLQARYLSHSRGGFTSSGVPDVEGIFISGQGNIIRDSDVGMSTGAGVTLQGFKNALVNCSVHDTDTIGCYACCVSLGGMDNLVSHNTLTNTGRDCLIFAGSGHMIQHNDISRAGRLCHDTGGLYLGGGDGAGTEIRCNWVHDINTNKGNGIYLDCFADNILVHHNVVWNVSYNAIQVNHPAHYNLVAHNLVFGSIVATYSPWNGQQTQFGSLIANNVVTGDSRLKPSSGCIEVATVRDARPAPAGSFEPQRDGMPPAAVDSGVVLPGINDGFTGASPDCGAYEFDRPPWRAGHDAAASPTPEFTRTTTLLRNHLRNGTFSREAKGTPFAWTATQGSVMVQHFPGYVDPPSDARFSVFENSLRLSGAIDAVVEQSLESLTPGVEFVFAAYVRSEGAEDVILSVRAADREIAAARYSKTAQAVWRHVEVPFRIAEGGPITVKIHKVGPGDAYIDNAGVSPVWPSRPITAP